jgi:hypothetical protein
MKPPVEIRLDPVGSLEIATDDKSFDTPRSNYRRRPGAPKSKLLTTDVNQLRMHLFAPVQRFGLEAWTPGPFQRLDYFSLVQTCQETLNEVNFELILAGIFF